MEQNNTQTVLCHEFKASDIMHDIDILDEYFGLGAQFFNSNIHFLHDIFYAEGKPIPEELDEKIYVPVHIYFDEIIQLLEKAGLSSNNSRDKGIMYILYFLANLIYDKEYEKGLQAIYEAIGDERLQYETIKKDLLKLYLFINDPNTKLDRPISIQHLTGKVKLDNDFGWFTRRMLKEYLDRYLPDITSLEQAKEALNAYKKQAGRKSADEREQILIYGIYRIFHEQTEMESDLPDRLCEFIFEYLKLIKVYDAEDVLDMSTMRPTIRYIIKKPVQPKFGFNGKMQRISLEELSRTGTKLY